MRVRDINTRRTELRDQQTRLQDQLAELENEQRLIPNPDLILFIMISGISPSAAVARGEHDIVDLLAATGLVASRSAGRRTIAEGGAYVNNAEVSGEDATVDVVDLLHGRWILLRRGRRSPAVVEVV
ncbi:hypothetical protein [Nocardia sp. NPDC049707]|uniref:hypothetical protein n=1 Tax=Nocardia sp. NPDC049707 TaxID=3154735 RepID=UPI00342D0E71